jgi:hypothetical protein
MRLPLSSAPFCRIAAAAILSLGLALAQAVTGGIFGSVTDSSGSAIVQAEITLVSETTGAERNVQTTHSGEFVIDGVEPGEYTVIVKMAGFKILKRTGIRLSPSERLGLGVLSLAVGTIDQQMTVTGEGATVQTASSERASSITTAQTEDLPTYGRTVTSLVAISPGVVDPVGAASRSIGARTQRTLISPVTVPRLIMSAWMGSRCPRSGAQLTARSIPVQNPFPKLKFW